MASVQLHVKPEFNYEEAAHAASDIVGSESRSSLLDPRNGLTRSTDLEGLPGEVSFLLEEIREKDQRIDGSSYQVMT